MPILSPTTKIWLHGLGAAFISALATGFSGAVAIPTVFNFSHDGLANLVKISVIPAMVAVAGYLKASPLPPLPQTVTEQKSTSLNVNSGVVTASESVTTTTGVAGAAAATSAVSPAATSAPGAK